MTELPICSWRSFCGPLAMCSSPKLRGGEHGFDPVKGCTGCALANHPATIETSYVTTHYRPKPVGGPGTHLRAMLYEFGATEEAGCGCESVARQMNVWGPGGSKEHRAEILAKLQENTGKAWWERVGPILEWCVDEAIRRAE